MRHPNHAVGVLAVLCLLVTCATRAADADPLIPQATQAYPTDLLPRLRSAATSVPGAAPREIRYLKMAESHRPLSAVLENGSNEPYVLARTVFQVVYPSGTVMIDSGMDEQVHKSYGGGQPEPYWPERNALVQQALERANLIVITHEHGDHVAGVIRSPQRLELAAKTVLTKTQVETLVFAPQLPQIRLTPEMAADYRVIDYALFYPVAPGVVLVKSPGHTPGHQMVYVRLAAGTEYMFIGDVSWALEGITEQRLKPPAQSDRIREDRAAIAQELSWLKSIADNDGVLVVPSHDERRLLDFEHRGLLAAGLRGE